MSINRISKEPQKGRSLIETLSMLAIMGVLSAVGVWGYKMAVQRHKSNELLSAANAIAHTVAMQYMVKESASISDMKNYGGFNFEGTIKTWGQQFGLRVKNVDEATCQYAFRSLGDRSILRWIGAPVDGGNDLIMNITQCTADNDLVLYYNKDLTTTAQDFYKTDFTDKQSCENAGQSWCGNADGTGVNLCYNNQCQLCQESGNIPNNNITNKAATTTCLFQGKTLSHCSNGACIDPAMENGKTCANNADCGGVGSGYYCYYDRGDNSRTCRPLNSRQFANTELGIFYKCVDFMPRESAYNWCEAQGMELLDYDDLNCEDGTISGTLVDTLNATWNNVTALWTSSDTYGVTLNTKKCGTIANDGDNITWWNGLNTSNYVICKQK